MSDLSLRKRMLLALLLGAAGFAANLLRLEIFFNVDFIFGSAFAMLAIVTAGPAAGLATAVIAGSATLVLWNHPWALVVASLEAACVGYLHVRRKQDLLLSDLAYWLLLGGPLVGVLYHGILGTDLQMTALVVLKQATNGIVNTLLASLGHKLWRARFRPGGGPRPAFRPTVFVTLVSLVTFPALLFLTTFIRREIRQEERRLAARAVELDRLSRQVLAAWIGDHQQAIAMLATLASRSDLSASERQSAVETVRDSNPAFKRIGMLDARAIVVAYSPLLDDQGRPVMGRDFSDRPYIPALKQTLRPMVADLVMGRVGRPEPILPLLAPIVRYGRYDGYCIGVTDTGALRDLLRSLAGPEGTHLTLVDQKGQVVATTRPELPAMAAFPSQEGQLRPLGEDVFHRISPARPGRSRMQRWLTSWVVHEGRLRPDLPWRVVVEEPFAPTIATLTRISLLGLGLLFVLILGTVALAQALSHGFTESVAQLEAATRAFPALLEEGPETRVAVPVSGIEEMHHLAARFEQMATALRSSFRDLRDMKDTLEVRVATRTAELQTALDTIKTLQGIIPICASCKKIRDDRGAWNQLEAYICEHTDAAFSHGLCPDCAERFREEARRLEAES